jgi:serine/threonine-protein kinase
VFVGQAENAYSRRAVDRYRLYEPIAAGGTATVHYGRMLGPVGFARTVAVKRLHREYARDPEFVAMFMDEARLAARVHHPNVVQTVDVVAAEGELFLVMEYLSAVSLSQLLQAARARRERPPAQVAAAVTSDVLRGLHAAHEATDEDGVPLDIVHRDVSPQNVLVGADGIARVLDFGIAKATGRAAQVTREGQVKGKFAYMAPEQVTNVGVSRQSDVFAASIVFWELLTGERLFQAESEPALLAAVLSAPIRPPSAIAAGIGPELDRILLRGLARDVSVRYASGREMAADIAAHAMLANPGQVGQWVEDLAGDDLSKRAARVAEIESESRSARVSASTLLASSSEAAEAAADAPSAAASPARRMLRTAMAIAAAGVLVTVAGGLALRSNRITPLRAERPLAEPPVVAAPKSSESVAPEKAPSPPEATDPVAPLSSHMRSIRPPRAQPGRPAPARSAATSGAAQSACDPPYYADSEGHLVYKSECFR